MNTCQLLLVLSCLALCSRPSLYIHSLGNLTQGFFFFFFKFILFIYYFWLCWVFIAACGLSLVAASRATLHCGVQASHCGGFSCCRTRALGAWASVAVAHRLSSCGSRALQRRLSSCGARTQLLHGMWDLPGPGHEPVSPALAGRFLTTVPPGRGFFF